MIKASIINGAFLLIISLTHSLTHSLINYSPDRFNSLRAHSEYYQMPLQSQSADLGKINFIESTLNSGLKAPDTMKGYSWKRRPYWYSIWRRRYLVVHQGTLSWGKSPDKLNKRY